VLGAPLFRPEGSSRGYRKFGICCSVRCWLLTTSSHVSGKVLVMEIRRKFLAQLVAKVVINGYHYDYTVVVVISSFASAWYFYF